MTASVGGQKGGVEDEIHRRETHRAKTGALVWPGIVAGVEGPSSRCGGVEV